MAISSKDLLDQVQQEFEAIIKRVQQMHSLPDELLVHKPSAEKWSAVECIEHLNLTHDVYLPNMQQAIQKAKHYNWLARPTFKPGFLGEKMAKGMRPSDEGEMGMRLKTAKKIAPVIAEIDIETVFAKFYEQHQALLQAAEEARSVDLQKARVTSLFGPIVRFRLGDAFRIIAAHDARHLLQAERAIESGKGAIAG